MYHYTAMNRKDQHVGLANRQFTMEPAKDFAETRFVHQSLPEMKVDDVDMSTTVAGIKMDVPFFINAMTGGSEKTGEINKNIARISYLANIPVASGSVSAGIKDPSVAKTFSVLRFENPDGIIFANLGAHHDVENAKRAVDLLEANALQIHLNAPQEIVMPEGDRDFSMWLTNIEKIVREIEVPVIVKEVGFGMSRETVQQLASVGVKTVDVSGTGGTDFIKIENKRRVMDFYDFLEGQWGQSTVTSIVEAMSLPEDIRPQIIASGGVKNPLDIVKALALGADLVGMSNRFLRYFRETHQLESTLNQMISFKDFTRELMTLAGAKTIAELRQKDMLLGSDVQNWCQARGIDWQSYANRSRLKRN
ncbi:type 2 isopentenyl-diphosphate Delta-isomerase [Streptococcus sp. X16XC17]|uniref:type 2 isopentenyl-diphosphate Delta-isomerase n=1 Tax=Streptococcus sp. X16XC17 TaxID=2316646 RepID=UPI00103C0B08|nr:type 2 isopentenyl-diphosphate Delta-isomerase [Streptococcus sp. X16XC17]TCD45734.1 type 2 isopentenyl-diphosphate Delta-isomerase [Streptococcus sp. X16XC17]